MPGLSHRTPAVQSRGCPGSGSEGRTRARGAAASAPRALGRTPGAQTLRGAVSGKAEPEGECTAAGRAQGRPHSRLCAQHP